MKASKLRKGDRIVITGVPGEGIPNYTIHRETVRVYKKLTARRRSVRIGWIDEYGQPWYLCKLKRKNGEYEWHTLAVMDGDTNWRMVKAR